MSMDRHAHPWAMPLSLRDRFTLNGMPSHRHCKMGEFKSEGNEKAFLNIWLRSCSASSPGVGWVGEFEIVGWRKFLFLLRHQSSVISHQLSVISYQLSVISYQGDVGGVASCRSFMYLGWWLRGVSGNFAENVRGFMSFGWGGFLPKLYLFGRALRGLVEILQ
jgi:hypothetical protein